MRCVAVDDEPLALSVIELFCGRIPSVELIATFTDSVEGLEFINENNVDLLFLDINIPHLNGIELAHRLSSDIKVIFTTAYQNFALEGFELHAADYLLKPFSFERFEKAVAHAESLITMEKELAANHECLTVKVDYRTRRIPIADILYIEGVKDYVKIHTTEKPALVKSTMKAIFSTLELYGFLRVHRSFIINHRSLASYKSGEIILKNGDKIPIGDQYKEDFLKKIER